MGGSIGNPPLRRDTRLSDQLFSRIHDALASDYDVEVRLGAGGMASVYRAVDRRLGRRVAIKVLRADVATEAMLERFDREARILARLEHPNIVRVHRADEQAGLAWYAMDLMRDGTLEDRLRNGPLPVKSVVSVARQLASALSAAHAVGVIHRDVKPANIFMSGESALLGDFGVASVTGDGGTSLTATGSKVGTPAYMAPELWAGGVADERSDIWALGATLYESLSGTRWLLATDERPLVRIPRELRHALQRALAADPADRWPSAAAFTEAIRSPRGRRWPSVAAALTLIAVAGAALVAYATPRLPSPPPLRPIADNGLSITPFGAPNSLGYRLARATAQKLEWFPPFRAAPFVRSASIARSRGDDLRASDLGSAYYVAGSVLGSGATAQLRVEIRDSTDHSRRTIEVPANDDETAWAAAVADSIAGFMSPAQLTRYRELSRHGDRNAAAVEAFTRCDEQFQNDDWAGAAQQCQRALSLDPRFPQALWTLSLIHRWQRLSTDEDLRRLSGVAADLPEPYGRLVRAQAVWALGARLDSLRAVAAAFPETETATFVQYDELFHRGPLLGIPLAATLGEMQVRSERDSVVWRALTDQLLWGYIRLGDEARARAALGRRLRSAAAAPASESARLARLMQVAYWGRFEPRRARIAMRMLLATADSSRLANLAQVFRVGGVPFDVPELQRMVGATLAVRRRASTPERASGLIGEAVALVALGRPTEAVLPYDAGVDALAAPAAPMVKCEWRVALAAVGMAPVAPSGLDRCRTLLRGELAGLQGLRSAVTLSLDAAIGRDTAALASLLERVASMEQPSGRRVADLIEAELAAARGDPARALALTANLRSDDSLRAEGGPFVRAVIFLQRGEWQLLARRPGDAAREWLWYQNSDSRGWPTGELQVAEVDAMLGGLARLRRAELPPGLPVATRCAEAGRVLELWKDAEAGIGPLVARLRRAATGCGA